MLSAVAFSCMTFWSYIWMIQIQARVFKPFACLHLKLLCSLKSEQTVAQCQTPCTWQLVDLALLICTGCNLDCHNLELVAADISLISSNSSFFFNPRTNPWSKDLCNQSLLLSPIQSLLQCSSNICQKCISPEKKSSVNASINIH